MAATNTVSAESIYQLPDEGRLGYVTGMNRRFFNSYIAKAANRLIATYPAGVVDGERLGAAMQNRIESLIIYNTKLDLSLPGVDLDHDSLESIFGTGSFITGVDMMREFAQPKLREGEYRLIDHARMECIALTAKFLSEAGLRERARPLMEKYGEAYVDHVLDERLGD